MGGGVVLWDFDGTLAQRPGLWGGCVLEVLDERAPGHGGTLERVRGELKGGFPWHRHADAHPELCDPETWWAAVLPRLEAAVKACGIADASAGELARAVRSRFVDASRGWHLFGDSRPALERAEATGWRNVVLSNHVPELAQLVRELGLDDLIEQVFSSARTGYEKPHPAAFRHALGACGNPEPRWMVGDNPLADVAGAEALGIPAILVRSQAPARRWAPDAAGAVAMILSSSG